MTESTYTVQLANTPDGDGDYCATVLYCGAEVKTFYRSTRDAALASAREWVTRHADHDPDDFETISL